MFFITVLGAMLSVAGINRQRAVWTYANQPNLYSLETFEIESAEEHRGGKGTGHWELKGHINKQEVSTIPFRLDIPNSVLEDLESNDTKGYSIPVLFAPSLIGKHMKGHTLHILESSIQGTTVANAKLEIALWNSAWILGAIGWASTSFYSWREDKQLLELTRLEDEKHRLRRKAKRKR